MAATSSRRVVSRRSHERPNSKADDPWCVICGVNLALDGRTFTVVSSHQNSELCDVFLRVLAMTFTSEQAFVNVCNRCERQLKRLGRSTSIAMARQEGRKFRAQVEGNVNKHGLQGVELGDFRNVNMTKPAVARKPLRDGAASSGAVMKRGDTLDEASNARKSRELYSRSNSSVRAEDKESGKRGAYTRDLSAPERKMHARDLHSSGIDPTDKTRDVLRGNRSSFQKPGVERTASFKPISDDTKSAVEKRGKSSIPSQQKGPPTRDGKPAIKKMNSVDVPRTFGKLTTAKVARDVGKHDANQPHAERKTPTGHQDNDTDEHRERKTPAGHQDHDTDEHRENIDLHNDSWELSSGELNPFAADIERENAHADTADVFQEHTRGQGQHAFHEFKARDGPMLTDDDTFIKNERAVFMESSQSSQSSSQSDDDAEKYRDDHSPSSPQINAGVDDPGDPHEDDQVRTGEQQTADHESKDRTKKLRVTFSESFCAETSHEPLITESVQSAQARPDSASDKTPTDKGDVQQDSCPLITETEDSREEHKDVDDFRDQAPEDEPRRHNGVLTEEEQPGQDGVLAGDEQRGQDGDEQRVPVEDDSGRATSESARDAGEGEDEDEEHGLIETDRLEQDKAALVSEVIQVTHLQPPAQLDDVDLKVDEEQTFVKDTADPNGSQVSLQPTQAEDASAPKSEASPLIDKDEGKGNKGSSKGKDSKFKDQQPGLPCCTIL